MIFDKVDTLARALAVTSTVFMSGGHPVRDIARFGDPGRGSTVATHSARVPVQDAVPFNAFAHADTSVASRLSIQNQLFAQQWEDDLRASPEMATAYGDNRFNARLNDYSLAGARRQHGRDVAYLLRLHGISTRGFGEQDRLSHDLLVGVLQQRSEDYQLKVFEMPLTQMEGVHLSIADLPRSVPLTSERDYDNYLSRLRQVPRAFTETVEVLRAGMKDGLMPPRSLLVQVAVQCQATIAENPFLPPVQHFPASMSAAARRKLRRDIVTTVRTEVLPAYRHFASFVSTEYAPRGRAYPGLGSLSDGAQRYANAIRAQTTTEMSAEDIHALGLREVARISEQLTTLARQQGYADVPSLRAGLLRTPRYVPASGEEIVEDFRRYVAGMQTRLADFFGVYPNTPLNIEPVPASQPGNGTHYVPGTPDGSRPARIVVATANASHRSMLSDETIAYHEGVPGHHLQISIQQQLRGLPAFRTHLTFSAYAEGWAVYSEGIAKEIGMFQDPGSEYGRLSTNLLRAARLVVDTGIHARGWSREQAIEYLRGIGAADEAAIPAEVDRYIAWPGQALSYKVGELAIRELRQGAETRLGAQFSLRAFHDEILSAGSLPLTILRARVNDWIGRQAERG